MTESTVKIYLVDSSNLAKIKNPTLTDLFKFKAKYKELVFLPETLELFVGTTLKEIKTLDPFYKLDWYHLGAVIGLKLENFSVQKVEFDLGFLNSKITERDLMDLELGLRQNYYKFDKYKHKEFKVAVPEVTFIEIGALKLGDKRLLNALDAGITLTRSLLNEFPEVLNPTTIVPIIQKEFENDSNVDLKLFDFVTLEKMGMNGITAVGRASRHKPVMIHATLKPQNKATQKICLIGKGLTYDSGGMDIKSGGSMHTMKSDKGGAMTMFGVMKALAKIGLKNTEVHWISAFAENMIADNAYKADDILTTYSGQTVEIFNTDAEGRLTLADALAYATLLDPDYIIDAATLTGACLLANHERFTGMFGNDSKLVNSLFESFVKNNEYTVINHLPEVMRKEVEGKNSDLINTNTSPQIRGMGQAGHVSAAMFLSHFVDQRNFRNPALKIENPKEFAWVHLDIAGSAFNAKNNQLVTEGATGQSVRGLVDWILAGE